MTSYLTGALRALPVALAHYAANTILSEQHRWNVIGRQLAALGNMGRLAFHAELFECRAPRRAVRARNRNPPIRPSQPSPDWGNWQDYGSLKKFRVVERPRDG